jgi:DNA-binding transcriptional MerR regulator
MYDDRVSDVTHETAAAGMTIDELARSARMTVRNVRAHQSRGLLPPPEIRGRTGFYGPEHLARLELIRELQTEGLNLEAIRRIIESTPDRSAGELLDFARALTEPFIDEAPEVVDAAELARPWSDDADPELLRRAQKLGLVRPLGDGRFEIRSPRLFQASRELGELGVPPETALELATKMKRSSESVARAFVKLFLEHVWRPFEAAGSPSSDYPQVRESLDRLRPLATQSLVAVFQMVMTDAVEAALERELDRMARGDNGRERTSRGAKR